MRTDAPRYRPAGEYQLPPHARYEIERARAGNRLFCPVARGGYRVATGLPPLYEDAAHLLKILIAHELPPPIDYHRSICAAADILFNAARLDASGADCAEFALYCLQGIPQEGALKREAKLKAMIGTFYTNLRTRASIPRER